MTDAFSIAAGAVGASVLVYSGATALFWSTLWFNIIPGIGTLISAAVVGGAIASDAILSKTKKQLLEKVTTFHDFLIEEGEDDLTKGEKLAKDLTIEDREKLISSFSITDSNANYLDIIALYDQTFSDTISENTKGTLFLRDCIYFHSEKSVYAQ